MADPSGFAPSIERITAERGDELFALARRWGRFGEADERGALNLLTPERTSRAASLVVDGTVVSCGRAATWSSSRCITPMLPCGPNAPSTRL